jgi:hypothetical protein
MGVNLWGESPLYVNPVNVLNILTKVLAESKGGTVRDRPEEASGKAMSRRTGTAYKAQSPGKSAPHDETLGSGDRVNAAVVQRKFTLLNFPEGTLFNRVNVLIRGDLSHMRRDLPCERSRKRTTGETKVPA